MQASPVAWASARDATTRRVISEHTELQRATEIFITSMSNITTESLGLDRFTRARAQRDSEEIEEYVRRAQNVVETHLTLVDTDLNGLQLAFTLFTYINPPPQLALPPPPPGGAPPPPTQATRERYKPEESFLGPKRDKVMFDVNTQTITVDDLYKMETYLKSSSDNGTVDMIQR